MTGEYAIRMMVHLSQQPPGVIAQISDISEKWQIPEAFLRKIAARLSRAGLVDSHRGVGAEYRWRALQKKSLCSR